MWASIDPIEDLAHIVVTGSTCIIFPKFLLIRKEILVKLPIILNCSGAVWICIIAHILFYIFNF
jgi:hypothetical protein